MAAAIVGLQAVASMVTTAPLSAPASASRRSKAGIATCSQDVSSTASWPSTRRSLVAKAETRCSAWRPALRSWLRREVLPSMAIRSGASGLTSRAQAIKQAENSAGSSRFISVRKPIGAGQAVMVGQEAAQEAQMRLAPIADLVIVVAGGDRAAHDEKQHLRQGIGHPPLLARVRQRRKMVQKTGQTRLVADHFHHTAPKLRSRNGIIPRPTR